MSRPVRLGLAAAVAVGAAFALAWLSDAPFRVHPTPHARVRIAFSARPERIERCRTLSADELANVPQHMRQSLVCEGTAATYRLEVRADDSLVASALLRGGGLRHDRRLYAFRELDVPSGRAMIDVRLRRVDSTDGQPAGERPESGDHDRDTHEARETHEPRARDAVGPDPLSRDEDEHRRRVADEVPSSLSLREVVTLRPREVLLVTYDQTSRRLHTVRGAP